MTTVSEIRLFSLFVLCYRISLVVGSICPDYWVDCGNGKCVAHIWKCDGENDCGNLKDEEDCDTPWSKKSLPDVRSESDLRRALFENYDKLVRPVRSVTDTIPVRTALVPVAIKDVDVKDKTVKLDTWFFIKWQDQFLTWDPSLYGGLQALRISPSEVWKPDLAVYYGTPDSSMMPNVHTNVVVFSNGTVLWVPPFTVKSRCPITENQVTEDTFQCTVSVGSWAYDVTLLDVQEYYTDVLQYAREDAYQDTDKDWTLESMTARTEVKHYSCCAEGYPVIRFEMMLRKKQSE